MSEKPVDLFKNTRKLRERESQTATSKSLPVLHNLKSRSQTATSTTRAGSSKEDCITIESSFTSDDGDDKAETADTKVSIAEEKSALVSLKVENRLRPKSLHHSVQNTKEIQLSISDISQRQDPYRRSKRNIVPKKEAAYGLLWKEEAELQRALNASIQAKRHKEMPTLTSVEMSPSSQSIASPSQKSVSSKSKKNSLMESDAGDDYAKMGDCDTVDEDCGQNFTFIGSPDHNLSNRHSGRRTRVRAQRKFASSSSPLEILNFMPNKWTSSHPQKVVSSNGKTEDFLTFLCLRRSSILPPHLECFKFGESDSLQSFPSSSASHASSCPGTPVSPPGPSGDSTSNVVSAPNTGSKTKSPSFQRNLFKKAEVKESRKKVLPSRNSSKFYQFQSNSWTRKRTHEQAKSFKISLKQRNETSKVAHASKLLLSSSIQHLHHRFTSRHHASKSSPVSPLPNFNETNRTSSLRTKATSEASLKSRLRATTQALSAAVIKEQQMFARRSVAKQLFTMDEEEDKTAIVMDPEKKSKARLTRSNSHNLKMDKMQPNSVSAVCSKDLQKGKKSEAAIRLRSGTGVGCEQRASTDDLRQSVNQQMTSTKEMGRGFGDGREFRNSSYLSSASSDATCGLADIQSTPVPQLPTLHPTAEQLQDFTNYVNECSKTALDFGMCRIIPPEGWKMNCNISHEVRFTPLTQYIHKMTQRWGPNVQHLTCIVHHIESQGGNLEHIPLVGGVETDMVALSQAVQSCGGIQQVVDKNKWPKVAEMLRIPSVAREKSSRLYEIYCRYLLSYDTLLPDEKKKLEEKVLSKRDKDPAVFDQPCVTKGRAKSLSEFFCMARNTQSMYFDEDPSPDAVQREYWRITQERTSHVAVQIGHIDSCQCSGTRSSLSRKKDAVSKEEQNLKALVHTHHSVLDQLTSISGVTESVLDIGMLFSSLCWSRDPHFLPCVYYLHTGSDVIWYSVPASEEAQLKSVMQHLVPDLIESNPLSWLDSVMISPQVLRDRGIRVFHTVQQQGQFIVVFPESFVANICCGYSIMEHINFIFSPDWLRLGCRAAQILEESCEPEMFSMEKLLVDLVTKEETPIDELKVALPLLNDVIAKELELRQELVELGLKSRRLNESASDCSTASMESGRKSNGGDTNSVRDLRRCDVSEKFCYFSMVLNEQNDVSYSLGQAVSRLKRRKNLGSFVLLYRFDEVELNNVIEKGWMRISGRRRSPSKRNAFGATLTKNKTRKL